MIKKCLKCNHVHTFKPGEPAEDCPACGANYAKVEAVFAARAQQAAAQAAAAPAATRAQRPATAPASRITQQPAAALSGLRATSHYPTFRATANAAFYIHAILCVLLVVMGIISMFRGEWSTFLGLTVAALLVFVFAKAAREASHMLADASDALVALVARRTDEA